jgi:molecular chaperone DnaK
VSVSYWLGIDLGSTFTAAAICRKGAGRGALPEVVPLGVRSAAVSSVVYLGEDGQIVVGEAAERRIVTDPERVVREFKRRIGDEVPMVIGGRPLFAHQIAAMVARWVVDRVAEREGGPAAGIVITHPAGWGPYRIELLAEALRAAGLPEFAFRTEPEAAATSYAVQARVDPGSTIAIYDFGGGTFDAAVVRKTGVATFSVLGVPEGIEQLGGVDFDEAVFNHVVAAVPTLGQLDPEDPVTLTATAALRRECTEAKEALSVDTEVTIPVLAPGIQAQVRLARAEFEDMIRPQVVETVEALRRALGSAGVGTAELDAVLLVGGSSRVPLVAQLVSAELGRPVTVDADPKAAIALGAALSALPADIANADPAGADPADSDAPVDALVPASPATRFARSDIPAAYPVEVPRPVPTITSAGIEPEQPLWRRVGSQRSNQLAAAGLLALIVAGSVTSALVLTSRSSPSPAAGTETSVPAIPGTPAPELNSENSNETRPGVTSGPVRPVPALVHRAPASAAVPAPQATPIPSNNVTTTKSASPPSTVFSPTPTPTPTLQSSSTPTPSSSPPSPSPTLTPSPEANH